MLLAAVGAVGSVLLTSDDESHKGMRQAQDLAREILFYSVMLSLFSFYSLNSMFTAADLSRMCSPSQKLKGVVEIPIDQACWNKLGQ